MVPHIDRPCLFPNHFGTNLIHIDGLGLHEALKIENDGIHFLSNSITITVNLAIALNVKLMYNTYTVQCA